MGCLRECTAGFAKYILFVFNLIILVAAIVLIVLAAKFKSNDAALDIMSVSSLAIAIGVLIGLIAFFGCCGAVKESSCLLTTYAVILILLFIIQVVLGVLAFVAVKQGDSEIKTEVHKYLDNLYSFKNNEDRDVVDAIQRNMECCGRFKNDDKVRNGTELIQSCCKENTNQCTQEYAYDTYCYDAVITFIQDSFKVIGGIAIGFSVIELVAAIFACYVKNTSDYA